MFIQQGFIIKSGNLGESLLHNIWHGKHSVDVSSIFFLPSNLIIKKKMKAEIKFKTCASLEVLNDEITYLGFVLK